ncbi:BURP domain-containing protein 3-like [Wolffia australiana]
MARSIIAVLFVAATVQGVLGGILPALTYWQTFLPATPIPDALRELLPMDDNLAKSSKFVGFGVVVPTPGSDGVTITVPVGGVDNVPSFTFGYATSETQVHDHSGTALFFLEKDLVLGSKMKVHFMHTISNGRFLPRSVVESLPFSSSNLPEVLTRLNIDPKSKRAAIISKTLRMCEKPGVEGENRYCVTSLESMVDFTTASLGSQNLLAISTKISNLNSPKQAYAISPSGVKTIAGTNAVVCHPMRYAYAVYYCHTARATKSYTVSLAASDGTKVEAVAVCHTDTSSWNPKHIAFQLLKVKPGKIPVCHFLPADRIVWARRP